MKIVDEVTVTVDRISQTFELELNTDIPNGGRGLHLSVRIDDDDPEARLFSIAIKPGTGDSVEYAHDLLTNKFAAWCDALGRELPAAATRMLKMLAARSEP